MSAYNTRVEKLAALARDLSPKERVRLIEKLAASLVSDESKAKSPAGQGPFEFPVRSLGAWPEKLSLRREDMYD